MVVRFNLMIVGSRPYFLTVEVSTSWREPGHTSLRLVSNSQAHSRS
jgi:hypothetical protein